jgi:7,8-dihydropterin-6-yl-methyl-4-(beta-D-ribofuranosyl)aminobenzene 5'-phosphate synthase
MAGIVLRQLVDNRGGAGMAVEHGYAVWIEAGAERVLLDTGAGTALLPNTETLGVDLAEATAIVLSHGHYDHTGGLADTLSRNGRAPVWFGPGVERTRVSRRPDREAKDAGMVESARLAFDALPAARRRPVTTPVLIAPGIGVSGPVPRACPFEDTGGPFFLDANGQYPDLIEDDQSLWIDTEGGLVIITGCCHAGIVNTVDHIRRATGVDRVRGIVGGLHLVNASGDRIARTLDALRTWAPEFVVLCHCTGDRAGQALRDGLGADVVSFGEAGRTIRLGTPRG